jgi:hypothetical protein
MSPGLYPAFDHVWFLIGKNNKNNQNPIAIKLTHGEGKMSENTIFGIFEKNI